MQAETSSNHQNLYEIPNCTICLNELTQDIANLTCGHVFHLPCISQHFQYRGTCPNCQKRSHQKEIRPVVYPLQKNTQSAQLMRQVLGNLSLEQKQQVMVLFQEVQKLTQKNQKLQNTADQAQKQTKKLVSELNETKTNLNRTKTQCESTKKDSLQMRKVVDHLHLEIKKVNEENFNLRQDVEKYKQKQADYAQIKKLKKIMHDSAQQLIDYKTELENKRTNPVEMAKQFFDMVLIKNLEVFNLKNKLQSFPEQINEQKEEIRRLESQIDRIKKQSKQAKEKMGAEKKKYDELKQKYRKLYEKYRSKCQENSQDENNEDSMLSRPSFPMVPVTNRLNSSGNGPLSFEINENSSSNIPVVNESSRLGKKVYANNVSSRIEEEKPEETKQQQKKSEVQKSLNSFLSQKPTVSLMSFGGIKPKKSAQEPKKPAAFKNLFA